MLKRIALLVPHTDITLESDLQRFLPDNYLLHTARMWLEQVDESAEKQMLATALPPAIESLADITEFSAAVFGCTSAAALYGRPGLVRLESLLSQQLNCPAISAFGAVLRRLQSLRATKICLLAPYTDTVNTFVRESLEQFGIKIIWSAGMGLLADTEIARVSPAEIRDFAHQHRKAYPQADALFISCTNLQAVEVQPQLAAEFGIPVLTSNSCIIDWLVEQLK